VKFEHVPLSGNQNTTIAVRPRGLGVEAAALAGCQACMLPQIGLLDSSKLPITGAAFSSPVGINP